MKKVFLIILITFINTKIYASDKENIIKNLTNINNITFNFVGYKAIKDFPDFQRFKWHIWNVNNVKTINEIISSNNIGIMLLLNNKFTNNLN